MSQCILDKIINFVATEMILKKKLTKYLDKRNVATREDRGTSYGIELLKKYIIKLKHKKLYALKIDLKNFFSSINHEKLKSLLRNDLDINEYSFISKIISSTDSDYINETISNINYENNLSLPLYKKGFGLGIGQMTSQFLAIFYLHRFHHYLIHKLKLKYFVNYMDDYIILSHDKNYLKESLEKIKIFLKEYYMEVNDKKTGIFDLSKGVNFLGYRFLINKNNKLILKLSKSTKQNIIHNLRERKYWYIKEEKNLKDYFYIITSYKYGFKYIKRKKINEIFERLG